MCLLSLFITVAFSSYMYVIIIIIYIIIHMYLMAKLSGFGVFPVECVSLLSPLPATLQHGSCHREGELKHSPVVEGLVEGPFIASPFLTLPLLFTFQFTSPLSSLSLLHLFLFLFLPPSLLPLSLFPHTHTHTHTHAHNTDGKSSQKLQISTKGTGSVSWAFGLEGANETTAAALCSPVVHHLCIISRDMAIWSLPSVM